MGNKENVKAELTLFREGTPVRSRQEMEALEAAFRGTRNITDDFAVLSPPVKLKWRALLAPFSR